MAKSNWGNALVKNLKQSGWVEVNGVIVQQNKLTVEQSGYLKISSLKKKQSRSKVLNTGWIDDSRNLRNKDTKADPFMLLVKQELGLDVWPEFFFSTDRLFRIDYAIPVAADGRIIKIAIEQEGGIWLKGKSGHSSGTGIKRDMEKSNLLQALGWKLIRKQPREIMTNDTLDYIKMAIPLQL